MKRQEVIEKLRQIGEATLPQVLPCIFMVREQETTAMRILIGIL